MSKQLLLHETIAILSADIYQEIYDNDEEHGGNYQETALYVIELAKKFEKELNWQHDDQRDYIEELEKFEDKVLQEIKDKYGQA